LGFFILQVAYAEDRLEQLDEAITKERESYHKEKKTFADSLVCLLLRHGNVLNDA